MRHSFMRPVLVSHIHSTKSSPTTATITAEKMSSSRGGSLVLQCRPYPLFTMVYNWGARGRALKSIIPVHSEMGADTANKLRELFIETHPVATPAL